MSWKNHITIEGYKMIYKGIDIGISREFISDLHANFLMVTDDMIYLEFERRYNSKLCVLRSKKIDSILS